MRFISLLMGLLCTALVGSCAPSEPRGPFVFAASSLQKPLQELADIWQSQGHAPPVLSFASSATLARQIDNGSPADLFISADDQWIAYLVKAGRIESDAQRTLATNALVVAQYSAGGGDFQPAPANRPLGVLLAGHTIATGDPDTVPLGRYARQALQSEGVWELAAPKLIRAASSSAALKLVLSGEADIGILYASDAESERDIAILRRLPGQSHIPIRYLALRLPASAHPEAAAFLDYLSSAEAAAVFARYGFGHA